MTFFYKVQQYFYDGNLSSYILQKLRLESNKQKLQKKILSATTQENYIAQKKIYKLLRWELKLIFFKKSASIGNIIDILSELIYQSNNSGVNKKKYEQYLNTFSLIPADTLSNNNWQMLGFICNINGLFRLSGICRELGASHTRKKYENNKSIFNLLAMFRLEFDSGNYDRAEKLLAEAQQNSKSNYIKDLHDKFYNYKNINDRQKILNKNQEAFQKQILNKNIVIIAPGLININQEVIDEVNSFDLIIFFNYKGNKIHKDFNLPFMSYYNSEAALVLRDSFDSFSNDLEFSVFKKISNKAQKILVNKMKGKTLDKDLDRLFFVQQPNLLQLLLDDLLPYRTNRIKVLGSNFYLNEKKYFDGYISDNKPNETHTDMWRAFAFHNILSQVNFIRNLHKTGRIELDQACLDVINMDESELLNAYELIYSKFE